MSVGYAGKCFSSTTRGDSEGVRFAPASEVIGKHPGRWMYIEFEVDEKKFEFAMFHAKKQVGKKYDFAGVAGFVVPFWPDDKKKWYCSEICEWFRWFCNWGERLAPRKPISPRRSALILAKMYHEPKPVK